VPFARIVTREQRVDLGQPRFDSFAETSFAKRLFHLLTDRFPRRGADLRVNAAVGDDLDVAVGEQQIDKHAAVFGRVPDAERAEDFDRPRARRNAVQQPADRKRRLDGETQLAAVSAFAVGNGGLDALKRRLGERAAHRCAIRAEMAEEAAKRMSAGHVVSRVPLSFLSVSSHQLPDEPPPPKLPPPPEKPPPLPPELPPPQLPPPNPPP